MSPIVASQSWRALRYGYLATIYKTEHALSDRDQATEETRDPRFNAYLAITYQLSSDRDRKLLVCWQREKPILL